MRTPTVLEWDGTQLAVTDEDSAAASRLEVADSWLVVDGRARALDLHRQRFLDAAPDAEQFWDAAIDAIPRAGEWFPRVERRRDGGDVLRLRPAPERSSSAVVATWNGQDPRIMPEVKGPDLDTLQRMRDGVREVGADEAVILDADGYVLEGAYSSLLWWRGDILCGPPSGSGRIDGITARTVTTIAAALGVETWEESVTPAELDGTEMWITNALQGIRIVTSWVEGPTLAELPGRLATWRHRLDALRRPL